MRALLRVLLSLGLLALLVVAWRGQWAFQFAQPRATGGWWLLGATLGLFVLWLLVDRGSGAAQGEQGRAEGPSRSTDHIPLLEWLAVAALCLLGVAYRIVHFSSVPGGMNHDAAFNGMYALHVLQGAPYTPYVSAAWGRETLFMYLCTPLVAWLGNVPEAIQIAGTLVGVATLPAFYLLARALCGRRVALLALAFLAVSGWHGVFSRVGWRMLMVPIFECIALFGLWRALQTGARRYWLLTGAGAALAIYTYDAGRVVPVMIGLMLAIFMLADRQRWRVRLLGGFVALATFVIVGAPMLWYAATHFEQFSARAAHLAGAEQHAPLWPTAVSTVAMFNYRANGNDFFVDEPLLEPLTGALFVFGFLVCVATIILSLPRGHFWPRGRVGEGASAKDVPRSLGSVRKGASAQDVPHSHGSERAAAFILIGLAIALVPGLLSVPNGNRCINALPFVYLIIAIGAAAIADAVARALAPPARSAAAVLLLVALVTVAGVETYREYLGEERRPILGFSPEATAAGEYLRGFGDTYTRYVVSEDWPEYTLAYLSYNGRGTPLENHYLMGRRLEDIEARINRFGRKGLVFLTDMKPAGRQALERLERLFAEHRLEAVPAARLGGRQVATALIVEPQSAARTGLWSNTTRALAVGGPAAASAVRCFEQVGDARGVSMRFQLMRSPAPAADGAPTGEPPAGAAELRFLTRCPPDKAAAALAVGFAAPGLDVRASSAKSAGKDASAVAIEAAALEAGRWYDVGVAVRPDGTMSVSVDGKTLPAADGLTARGAHPLRIAGIELGAPAGMQLFVDDLAVAPGLVQPGAEAWAAVDRKDMFQEDFETTPYGLIATDTDWRRIDGPVSALASPAAAARAEAPPPDADNAFDGGRGSGPGQFNDPVGLAIDAAGDLYVADKDNHRIQQFNRAGAFIRAWGQKGEQPGEFNEPHDVAVDDEFVYVADTWNQRVQVFDHNGAHVFTITGEPSMASPRAVFARDKLIYVAEPGAGRVTVYDRAGKLRRTIGVLGGDAAGHLAEPVDVTLDRQGDVWVVNSGNNRIEHFAADGTPRGSIPVPGWSGPHLKESYLAIDDKGTFYLGDWEQGTVRRLRPDGSELEALGVRIQKPSGLALDRNRVLVVARGEDVVRVLPLESGDER